MKIKSKRFKEITLVAKNQPDEQMFLAEYGVPEWIFEEITEDEQEAVKIVTDIYRVTRLSPKELIAEIGMNQSSFSRRFGIPLRTVQGWCLGEREMPDYIKYLIAELTGLIIERE